MSDNDKLLVDLLNLVRRRASSLDNEREQIQFHCSPAESHHDDMLHAESQGLDLVLKAGQRLLAGEEVNQL